MTAVPDRRLVIQDPTPCWCQAATASSLQKEMLLRCSTLLMSSATTPLDLTCPPLRLLPLVCRDSWRILPRSMETSSTRLSWMTDSGLLEDYSQTIVQYMLVNCKLVMYFSTQIFIYLFETIKNAMKKNFNKWKTKFTLLFSESLRCCLYS